MSQKELSVECSTKINNLNIIIQSYTLLRFMKQAFVFSLTCVILKREGARRSVSGGKTNRFVFVYKKLHYKIGLNDLRKFIAFFYVQLRLNLRSIFLGFSHAFFN